MTQFLKQQRIAVDFDGTLVEQEYPDIGSPVPGAGRVLRRLVDAGHLIILWTCRSGEALEVAVRYVTEELGIPLHAVNANGPGDPWKGNPKAWAHTYIDEAALGCPLVFCPVGRAHPMVDWYSVEVMLEDRGYLEAA